jgi:hypothetical protein
VPFSGLEIYRGETTSILAFLRAILINHDKVTRQRIMSWLTAWIFRKYELAQEQSRRNQIAWLECLTPGIVLFPPLLAIENAQL